jgi:hypothetical protein
MAPPGGAPPGPRPGRPRPHGGPRPGTPGVGPPGKPALPPGKSGNVDANRRRYYYGRPRYWYPTYTPKVIHGVYGVTGYPYYVGGTSYTVIQAPSGDTSGAAQPAPSESATGELDSRYNQMLELTDMIFEWRTLNESPEFQERIPDRDAEVSDEVKQLVRKISRANRDFDRLSRQAMQKLAGGQDASREVDRARDVLDRLMAAAEDLPAPPKS